MPQIIKKHTHTRTIFKHHFVKPKTPKTIIHAPIIHSISASPSSLKLGALKAVPTFSESDSIKLGLSKNLWRPSPAEYRASELGFIPNKLKINKKKNPFKLLEVMAEAHAEGHNFQPQILKKHKPIQLDDDDDSQTSDYIPDYMLVDNSRYGQSDLYNSDDESNSDVTSGSKADLIYVAPHDKHKTKKGGFLPSRSYFSPTISTKKKSKIAYDWTAASSSSSSMADSEYEPEHYHLAALKKSKSRKPKRLAPTLGPSEDHINILQMTRKPISILNYTKYKNRLSNASRLNTHI